MSVNNEGEYTESHALHEVVLEALRQSGALGRLRAQIRASVLDVVHSEDPDAFAQSKVADAAEGSVAVRQGLDLLLDFLRTYSMASEGSVAQEVPPAMTSTRSETARALGITPQPGVPLLVTVLEARQRLDGLQGPEDDAGSVAVSDHTATADRQSDLLGMDTVVDNSVTAAPATTAMGSPGRYSNDDDPDTF